MFENQLHRTAPDEVDEKIINALDYVATAGKKYIDIVSEYNLNLSTTLDKERKCMCLKEMAQVVEKVSTVYNKKLKKKMFGKLQNIHRKLEALILDVQDCWPDVFLWMICGTKRVACFQIPARDIAFSAVDEEKGEFCGVKRSICLYIFQLRAHVLQGKISAGFDKSGLADTFVRIIIGNQLKDTQVVKISLHPVWDEMLILNNIVQYGSKSYIKNSAPDVVLEVFDKDSFLPKRPTEDEYACLVDQGKTELVGRCSVTPVVKFIEEPYSPPVFPPKLKWHKMVQNKEVLGEVLAALELLEVSGPNIEETKPAHMEIVKIPNAIKPEMVSYKIEVLFWGVRDMKKVNHIQINRPRISVICGDEILLSDTIENGKRNSNFSTQCKSLDVACSCSSYRFRKEYDPPLCMKLHDSRRFGVYTFAGVHVSSIAEFKFFPITAAERTVQLSRHNMSPHVSLISSEVSLCPGRECPKIERLDKSKFTQSERFTQSEKFTQSDKTKYDCRWLLVYIKQLFDRKNGLFKSKTMSSLGTYEPLPQEADDSEDFDWWTKFYDSIEKRRSNGGPEKGVEVRRPILKIYPNELERQPEFKGFTDILTSFEMYKRQTYGGRNSRRGEHNRRAVKIYRWPLENDSTYVTPCGLPLTHGVFQSLPSNEPLRYLLRVYCVRAIGLRPKDLNGKSDPYLWLNLNDKVIKDRQNHVAGQVDPVFGKCFEFNGSFPNDYSLTIAVWDFDKASADDLIGETKIDLENRFYTKHRAYCGIAENYDE
ncbi:hypothetical protein NQ317_007807 [Molorchus minor]|uniref:C2 domain-containing protein n=1 Tax=Molorchus minor TaxID=1323400 RepID=A0ABQ9IS45_9CUCU|nr:hypothetical protein NQ317_007807 [Molorchus minor]